MKFLSVDTDKCSATDISNNGIEYGSFIFGIVLV